VHPKRCHVTFTAPSWGMTCTLHKTQCCWPAGVCLASILHSDGVLLKAVRNLGSLQYMPVRAAHDLHPSSVDPTVSLAAHSVGNSLVTHPHHTMWL
jgi:hypothetical protein